MAADKETPGEEVITEEGPGGESPVAEYVREGYEPHFDRLSTTRRVLGHITDEEHVGRGPRNTSERLEQELVEDPNTQFDVGDGVQSHLDDLVNAGLVVKRQDGTYEVTEDGLVELVN